MGGPGLIHILDPRCPGLASTATLCANSADRSVGHDRNSGALNDFAHGIHDTNKPTLGIENAVFHVQVAHEVEHARCNEGARAEKNSRIAQKLLNTGALRVLLGERHNRRGQQTNQGPHALEHLGDKEWPQVLERRVEEVLLGNPVGVLRRVEILLHRLPGSWLHRLQQCEIVLASCPDIDILGSGRALRLEIHPVAGIQLGELKVGIRRGPHQAIPVIKNLGHQIPGWPRIKTEPVLLPQPCAPTQSWHRLDQRDGVAVFCQEASSGHTANTATNDDYGLRHSFPFAETWGRLAPSQEELDWQAELCRHWRH